MSFHSLTGHETLARLVGKRRNLKFSDTCSSSSVPEVAPKVDVATSVTRTSNLFDGKVRSECHVRRIQKYQIEFINAHRKSAEDDNLVAQNPLGRAGVESIENVEQKHFNEGEWVQCPICWRSIKIGVINTHIDFCLQACNRDERKKRKQLTLSQFCNYASSCKHPTSSPKVQRRMAKEENQRRAECGTLKVSSASERLNPGLTSFGQSALDLTAKGVNAQIASEDCVCSTTMIPQNEVEVTLVAATREKNTLHLSHCERLQEGSVPENPVDLVADIMERDKVGGESAFVEGLDHCVCQCHISGAKARSEGASESHLRSGIEGDPGNPALEETCTPRKEDNRCEGQDHTSYQAVHDSLREVMHTTIVGRRFNRRTACKLGMKITILREADNPEDPNAIKVVQMDNPTSLRLGHLSRDISLHLSCLLEKGYLKVWGSVTALPDQAFGPVPITLFCETVMGKEAFLKLDGAEESLRKAVMASTISITHKRTLESVRKYQQNFLFMLQTVLGRDSHLFTDKEKIFLETFSSLSDQSQRLFIKLYQRKGPWFRLSTLDYTDVADVVKASSELLTKGYMTGEDCLDETFQESLLKKFAILNVMELRQLLTVSLMKKKGELASFRKDDLIKEAVSVGVQWHRNHILGSTIESGSSIIQLMEKMLGPIVRVSEQADFLMWRIKRLFFLNGGMELSSFLVVDMGLVKYPRYKCWREKNIFESRESLLAYEQALEVAQRMDVALDKNDFEVALKYLAKAREELTVIDASCQEMAPMTPTFLGRFSASYIYRQVCTLGISILEREHRYSEAIDVLRQLLSNKTLKSGRWGHWTLRLSIDLYHLGFKEESLQVAEVGVCDPWIRGGDLVALQRRVARLAKPPRRWKIPPYVAALGKTCKEVQIQGRPLNCEIGAKSWFYGYDGQQCRVEELALQHYASDVGGGWRGLHCEGGVWMTLFGILMWDVLFADIPDVFQNAFQVAPLDLDTEVFFSSREGLIEAKLGDIAQKDCSSLLAQTWNQNFGTLCRGVNWERYPLEQLQEIAQSIGGPGLSAVCKLLAEDYAGWTGGMPDLLLWRFRGTSSSKQYTSSRPQLTRICFECGCPSSVESCDSVVKVDMGCEDSRFLHVKTQQRQDTMVDVETYSNAQEVHQIQTESNVYGEAKLVEVKGPRDRLSEQQRAWTWILMNAGLDVEVCKVVEMALE